MAIDMENELLSIKTNKILIFMYFICFSTAIWISQFVCLSIARVTLNFGAREFIAEISGLPGNAEVLAQKTIFYMLMFGVTFGLRTYFGKKVKKIITITLVVDYLIAFRIIILLNFNYNGVLLWVFTNFLAHLIKSRFSGLYIGGGVISYVITDKNLASMWLKNYNIADYISVYSKDEQSYFYLTYNILNIMTIIAFFACCLFIIMKKDETIKKTKDLYEQLSLANSNLIKVNKELECMVEENEKLAEIRERNRIAREIHDTMGHTLTGIIAGIDACIALAKDSPEILREQLKLISEVSRKGVEDIRASVSSLRPDTLERLNLNQTLYNLIENTRKVMGVEVEYYCNEEELKLDEDEENAIYRIVQECITNAIRHGMATKITVLLEKRQFEIYLKISDNGIGCTEIKEGFGTRHMKERVEMLNGTVNFANKDGFVVEAVVPIRWGKEYD